MKTLAFHSSPRSKGGYIVLVHTAKSPDHAEWSAYVQEVAVLLSTARAPVHAFVATDGGSPDAAQRRSLAEVFNQGDALTHVFTEDAFIRGVVTAFRWIARARAVAHSPSDFSRVCEECEVAATEVLVDFNRAQEQLSHTITMLQRIRESMSASQQPGTASER
jgi:hypothetical protein